MMALFSKNHYELLDMFEKHIASSVSRVRLTREDKSLWAKGHVYQDGLANDLFLAFRAGAAYAEAVGR